MRKAPKHTPKREIVATARGNRRNLIPPLCITVLALSVLGMLFLRFPKNDRPKILELPDVTLSEQDVSISSADEASEQSSAMSDDTEKEVPEPPEILERYGDAYEQNHDMIGWLSIEGTNINYPVMQTMWDEQYYLRRSFDGEYDIKGCLLMDTDSTVGSGTARFDYQNGSRPSTNLIIHGHTMRDGQMFGNLNLYADAEYGKEHSVLRFDSLYEEREYELISAFYSQVFYADQDVFKYYKFFQADTQQEFDDWYDNIKAMSLYDTGVTAELGDEFLTLSCCAYHVEDGRFVVVAKRVK